MMDYYPTLAAALLKSMQNHNWYITEEMVGLALAEDDVETETKLAMMEKLLTFEVPSSFRSGRSVLPLIKEDTTLTDLVGPNSWHLLQISSFSHEDVVGWLAGHEVSDKFIQFVKLLTCVNDCAKRNICLLKDFISG